MLEFIMGGAFGPKEWRRPNAKQKRTFVAHPPSTEWVGGSVCPRGGAVFCASRAFGRDVGPSLELPPLPGAARASLAVARGNTAQACQALPSSVQGATCPALPLPTTISPVSWIRATSGSGSEPASSSAISVLTARERPT